MNAIEKLKSAQRRRLWNAFRLTITAGTIVVTITCSARAQNGLPLDQRMFLGVGTHQGLDGVISPRGYVPAINIKQIKELGLTAFRDDFMWDNFELPGHEFGFTPLSSRLETQIKSNVAMPVLILGYGHRLVPNSNPPSTDEARQRFVDYAVAAGKSFAGRPVMFELWNEWNLKVKDPNFSSENYTALARAVYPALKQEAPNIRMIVGAIGDDSGWHWTNEILQSGILKYADGISIHLYNFCMAPQRRNAAEIIERLEKFHELVDRANGGSNFPIYVTETGWPTARAQCGVSEQNEADNMSQLILWASTASSWLKGISFYELKDSGTNPSDLEQNFGLYHFDNSPKPAACSVGNSWSFIRSSLGAHSTKLANNVVLINSTTAEDSNAAIWSEDPTRRYEVRLKSDLPGAVYEHPCDGASKSASGVWMTVSSTPLLIRSNGQTAPAFEIRSAQ